jgi:hypothetical protein
VRREQAEELLRGVRRSKAGMLARSSGSSLQNGNLAEEQLADGVKRQEYDPGLFNFSIPAYRRELDFQISQKVSLAS